MMQLDYKRHPWEKKKTQQTNKQKCLNASLWQDQSVVNYALPTGLCFMPEFSNQLGGVLVQWSMGLLLSLEYLTSKSGEVIPLCLSRQETT